MDTRRVLTVTAAACLVSGCASLGWTGVAPLPIAGPVDEPALTLETIPVLAAVPPPPSTARPYLRIVETEEVAGLDVVEPAPAVPPARTGRAAIAAANGAARAPSRSDQFLGGVQVFAWSPGRVYEVWTAPLRVTTLTLGPGETIVSKAAGDTVRWQIGDTTSGTGPDTRSHVLLKPLERGLETNLVLATSHRVYWLELKSGPADAYNAAVAWDLPEIVMEPVEEVEARTPDGIAMPQGPLDAHYRIRAQGRAPRWMPTAVFNDGVRTFITFPPDVWTDEAPTLFVVAGDGQAHLVNYRQQGALFVVDRVFDLAELRSGDGRPRIVRLQRLSGGRP